MCTYRTEIIKACGSGKGPNNWMKVTEATVYLDHPVHAPFSHSINIDLRNGDVSAVERVALELEPASALRLAKTILQLLKETPATITEVDDGELASA